jgi:hypothetical protein
MRKLAFFAPLAATLAVAGAALAQPTAVNVTVGPDLQRKADELGQREVLQQVDRLADVVTRALADDADLHGATVDLVLTDLKPNRPTMEQLMQRPGLDGIRSVSIGGAAVEGRIVMADGSVRPIRYDWYTNTLADVRGFTTWQDADRAYHRLARNLAEGRYETR